MSSGTQSWKTVVVPGALPSPDSPVWYAVHTFPRHEKAVSERMRQQGLTAFLPTIKEVHRWSDRRKSVELPLFSCYVFAKIVPSNEERIRILRTHGVIGLVGTRGEGTPIPDEQMDAIRTVLAQDLACGPHPFLKIGQRVRVRSGALDGLEGVLISKNGDNTLVVSVDAIQRSLAVRIDGYQVEAV
jgi:transcription antitermination factor NusG